MGFHFATRFILPTMLLATSAAMAEGYSHQEYFDTYEGTATCLACHEDEAQAFFHSQHYQWQGQAPDISNADGQLLGKMNTINDFCTNPGPNWIGEVRNEEGKVVAQGCSKCHAGLGLLPSAQLSRRQLENIDCLICHASGYRRDLYQAENGAWQWRPILWKNQKGLDSVAKRISRPERRMCLRCHSGAGGGPNFKRGDIEYELADCSADFDVHMATEGNNLDCVACHGGQDHRIRGRGTDLSGTDSPAAPLRCTDCHDSHPHGVAVLDAHTDRVYCTVCHIPSFAKSDPTDMRRDWSRPVFKEELGKYSADITLKNNVQPVYAWYNGRSRLAKLGEKPELSSDNTVGIMLPEGSRNDPEAMLYAFKLHRGVLPATSASLIPIAVEEFFADGDIEKAVAAGAASLGLAVDSGFEWVDTVRYMGIFHEVVPAEQALQCLDCHRENGRIAWQSLGYEQDPLAALLK